MGTFRVSSRKDTPQTENSFVVMSPVIETLRRIPKLGVSCHTFSYLHG